LAADALIESPVDLPSQLADSFCAAVLFFEVEAFLRLKHHMSRALTQLETLSLPVLLVAALSRPSSSRYDGDAWQASHNVAIPAGLRLP
jgi:hypothetical protein